MLRTTTIFSVFSLVAITACTVTNEGGTSSSGGSSGTTSSSGGASSSSGSSDTTTGSSSGDPKLSPPSTTPATVAINGSCPSFTACGGDLQGTFDYTSGCVSDVFAAARQQCPSLDASNAKVTVTGSLYFAGNGLVRKVSSKIEGSIKLPASCTQGQCALVESALKSGFDSVSCTGTSDCTCTVTKLEANDSSTTFTVSGSVATTADGDTYDFCEKAGSLQYSGKSAGAEEGLWTLNKR